MTNAKVSTEPLSMFEDRQTGLNKEKSRTTNLATPLSLNLDQINSHSPPTMKVEFGATKYKQD